MLFVFVAVLHPKESLVDVVVALLWIGAVLFEYVEYYMDLGLSFILVGIDREVRERECVERH